MYFSTHTHKKEKNQGVGRAMFLSGGSNRDSISFPSPASRSYLLSRFVAPPSSIFRSCNESTSPHATLL